MNDDRILKALAEYYQNLLYEKSRIELVHSVKKNYPHLATRFEKMVR